MKTNMIRAFVVALALTGAFAVTHAAPTSKVAIAPVHTGTLPVPSCDPNTSDCGIGG